MGKKIKCPKMFCNGTGIPANVKKGYKTGKGVINGTIGFAAGGVLGLGVGAMTGLNGKKKTTFVCSKCGYSWTEKV